MQTYDFCLVAGGLSLLIIGAILLRRSGARTMAAWGVPLTAIVSALIGARLLSLLLHVTGTEPNSGFSLDGGLVLGSIGAVAACAIFGLNPLRSLDLLAPGAGIAAAFSKVGCFMAGCCWGVPTNFCLSVPVARGSKAHLQQIGDGVAGFFGPPLEVHPVQLYESAAGLIGTLVTFICLRRGMSPGSGASVFAVWFFGFRAIEFQFRYPDHSAVISPQFIAIFLFFVASVGLAMVNLRTADSVLRGCARWVSSSARQLVGFQRTP